MTIDSGFFAFPWWADALIVLGLTHVTIISVTIFLHRHQAHRALDLHPAVSHFFRFWLWLTTGMVTKEWVAVHRKHHAKCETPEDPHSPQTYGLNRVLWGGVFLYHQETHNRETMERYGHGTPDDWVETHLYTPRPLYGVIAMALIDVALLGVIPGGFIFLVQMLWIPFWAAGVINGLGHFWGYRNFPVEDASTNIFPWGVLIGGEELHNNHHAYATSAKLSNAWYEFDIGWMYIRILAALGLAQVKKAAAEPRFVSGKSVADAATLQAILTHRYYVLAQYTRSVRNVCRAEIDRLSQRSLSPVEPRMDKDAARNLLRWLKHNTWNWRVQRPIMLEAIVSQHKLLSTVHRMRRELSDLWSRSNRSTDQLLEQLRDWCHRAEFCGIPALQEFSRQLPKLASPDRSTRFRNIEYRRWRH